jgi:iron(III) transport system permease protein
MEGSTRVRPSHWLLTSILLVFFAVFLIWPIVQVTIAGFLKPGDDGGFTLDFVKLIFTDPTLVRGLINSAILAVIVTTCTLLLALPLATLSVRYEFPFSKWMGGLMLVPLVLPPFVGAIGMKLILGREGTLTQVVDFLGFTVPPGGIDWIGQYRFFGIIVVEVLHLYPILLVNLQAALANVDPAMEQAAANIGAKRSTIFRRITLPLIRPGLFAGCTLVLIWSFTELGTPLMFDFQEVTAVQVFARLSEATGGTNPLPFALVIVMLFASVALYIVGKLILGRGFDAATTKASTQAVATKLTGLKGWLVTGFFMLVFFLAVIPHLSVILTAVSVEGSWYKSVIPTAVTDNHFIQAMRDELAMPSVANSILYAGLATMLAVVLGLATAIVVVRTNVPIRGFIDTLAMLPLAVPGLVMAFGYLSISVTCKKLMGDNTPFWLDVQEFPIVLLVFAYAARRMPYIVRSAVAGLQQTPRDLELAAANLGAGRWTVLRRITTPLIVANLIAGGLLAFAFAMLEVSDSLILAQKQEFFPITKAIWELSNRLGDGMYIASALGVWAMVLLTLTILSANAILSKKMGAIFRV